jgi:hypothetical protein
MRMYSSRWAIVAVVAVVGCNKSPPTPTGQPTPWGFRITWPGEPTEMPPASQKPGEPWTYMAFYTDKTPGRLLLYGASVTELGARAGEMSPKEHLAAFKHAFQKDESSRKEFEHGPKKLPGLDIVSQRGRKVSRERAIASGTRVYSIMVTAPSEDTLNSPEVKRFFESFGVDE